MEGGQSLNNNFTVKRNIAPTLILILIPLALVNIFNVLGNHVDQMLQIILIAISVSIVVIMVYMVIWVYRHRFDQYTVELTPSEINFNPGKSYSNEIIKEIRLTKYTLQFHLRDSRSALGYAIDGKHKREIVEMLEKHCMDHRIEFINK
jgi:NADH:ubiquinone oxidoreductase subunit K